MKYAWIEDGKVRDVCHGNPNDCYHEDIATLYNTMVPDDAVNGDGWVNNQLVKPVVSNEPATTPERTIDISQIRLNLTLAEKVKWDNDSTPEIITAKVEFANNRTIADATNILQLLVDSGSISQQSMDNILA